MGAWATGHPPSRPRSRTSRSLRRQATKLVVLLVPDITSDFYADVAISLERDR
jgi:DNA-binding LacI/PurR family transcriptional regulator